MLTKNYFSSIRVYSKIYNKGNRIDTTRFKVLLDQVSREHLSKAQQKLIKDKDKQITKLIKKKIAAARLYQRRVFENTGRKIEAAKVGCIDLTVLSDGSDNEDETDQQPTGDKKPKVMRSYLRSDKTWSKWFTT